MTDQLPTWNDMAIMSAFVLMLIVGSVQVQRYDLAVGASFGLVLAWGLRVREELTGGEES